MSWEYLPEMDKRLEIIAKFLDGKTKDKTIVDIDCLEARLLKYIKHDFKKYIGNDVLNKFPIQVEKTEFYLTTDDKMVDIIEECDILLLLGHGGHKITGEAVESSTIDDSVEKIINKCLPEYVVKEAIRHFESLIDTPPIGYEQVYRKEVVLGEGWTAKRVVYIYKKTTIDTAIVVGCYSEPDKLIECLDSVYTHTQNFSLIGINQGKDSRLRKRIGNIFNKLKRDCDSYIYNSSPVGVYDFWNQGILVAIRNKNKNIAIINDDIIVGKDWLKRLLEQKKKYELDMIWTSWTSGDKPKDFDNLVEEHLNKQDSVSIQNMAGFCFLCETKLYKEFGLFNNEYKIHGGDSEFFYNLLLANKKTRQSDNVLIHHYYSTSLNKIRTKAKDVLDKDHLLLKKRFPTVPEIV